MRKKAGNADQNKISQPVTVRTLETILRLATAHAKLRYSKRVEVTDIDQACVMLRETIFQENLNKQQVAENVDMNDSDDDNENSHPNKQPKNLRSQRAKPEPSSQASPNAKK